MRVHTSELRQLLLIALVGTAGWGVSCRAGSHETSWNSKRIMAIREEVRDKTRDSESGPPKSHYVALRTAYVQAIRSQLSSREIECLIDSLKTLPRGGSSLSQDQILLVDALVIFCCEQKDRALLTRLLATACPEYVELTRIESYVARAGPGRDPILILADAFDAASDPEVRGRIADAFRAGFASLNSDQDEEVVRKSREWYMIHRDEYVINPDYDDYSSREIRPLFIRKR